MIYEQRVETKTHHRVKVTRDDLIELIRLIDKGGDIPRIPVNADVYIKIPSGDWSNTNLGIGSSHQAIFIEWVEIAESPAPAGSKVVDP